MRRVHPVVALFAGVLAGYLLFPLIHLGGGGGEAGEYDAEGMTKEQRAADEVWGDAARRREIEEYGRNAPRPAVVKAPLLAADTMGLADTVVVPVAASPLPTGKNVLWCATWQLCWDGLCDEVVRGPLTLGPPAPPEFSAAMNLRSFPQDALDPDSCLAMAGLVRDGIVPRIRSGLKERFYVDMPDPGPLAPGSAVVCGYLRKSLPFEVLFEPRYGTMTFAGGRKRVSAFGINQDSTYPEVERALAQVTAWSAGQEGDVVLEFAVKGGRDRLLLAMVAPGATLEETWRRALQATEDLPGEVLGAGCDLAVPRMNFEVSHRFREILGGSCPGVLSGQGISEARQTIRFSLDEGGAEVASHALIATLGVPSSIVLDRPFLVALLEKGRRDPYLLLWIANDELLAEGK